MPEIVSQAPIKIAFLISSFRTGGRERLTVDVLKLLNREKFDPFLVVMKDGELLEALPEQRVYQNLVKFKGDIPGYVGRLRRILREEQPQIIVLVGNRWDSVVARFIAKVPVMILELHGLPHDDARELLFFDRLLLSRTDHLIAIGLNYRAKLLAEGVPDEKITVIPNGVDTEKFKPTSADKSSIGLPSDALVIGCVAKLRPEKNLGFAIAALPHIREQIPQAHLVLVGDGEEQAKLEAQVQVLGLQDYVHFLGLRHDVPDVLATFDIAFLSSKREGVPLSVLEAQAAGRPVVAPAIDDLPTVVLDEQTGLLFPTGDTNAFVDCIVRLLKDKHLREAMGKQARQHILEKHSMHALIRQREELFTKLLLGVRTK